MLRRSVRRFGYRVVHAVLPAPVRKAVRSAFGGPSRFDERQASKKEVHARRKQELQRMKLARTEAKTTRRGAKAESAAAKPEAGVSSEPSSELAQGESR
jgi:hypothetical protein